MRNETLIGKGAGIVPENTTLPPRDPYVKAYGRLLKTRRKVYARLAEVHAGYVDYTDQELGRFLDYLEQSGILNNTIIVLVSDNGASPEGDANGYDNMAFWSNGLSEGGDFSGFLSDYQQVPGSNISTMLSRLDLIGGPMSYPTYPLGWAMAENTPNRLYKWTTYQGGVHDAMIISWPARIMDNGSIRTQFCHAIDVVPIIRSRGHRAPEVYNGYRRSRSGNRLVYRSSAGCADSKDRQYFEMMGTRGSGIRLEGRGFHHEPGGNFDQDTRGYTT